MAASTYIYPTVISMPLGYITHIPIAVDQLESRLLAEDGCINARFDVFRDGKMISTDRRPLHFKDRKIIGGTPEPFRWSDSDNEREQPFGEVHFEADDGRPIFTSKQPLSTYATYAAPGKKSFFSDNSYKYGSPPIINQMAMIGQFVETFTVVRLDRSRDLGETLVFINPYKRAINVRVLADDGREIPKFQVKALSCLHVPLSPILGDDESWLGQIQLTGNNRLVVFHIKHSLRDQRIISDHEHLDPYRAEETHWPLSVLLRTLPAKLIKSTKRALGSFRAQ